MTPVDALFIATSAVCVTGLSVIDVSKETGVVSQLVLLSLIQIGGLGIMTGMMLMSLVVSAGSASRAGYSSSEASASTAYRAL